MLIAALPMYDLPELQPATNALWAAIATRLRDDGVIDVPHQLTRGAPLDELWASPDLLLGQTCGYPLVTRLQGRVTLVATPCYGAPGCAGSSYRSAIVVRRDDPAAKLEDLRRRRCAVNEPTSNSGMNLLRAAIAPLASGGAYFDQVLLTGAHVASVEAIRDNAADVAAIDCVTWAHLQRLRPALTHGLRVLAWTAASPGLPLITSNRTEPGVTAALRRALGEVAQDPSLSPMRAELMLTGFEILPPDRYDSISQVEQAAIALGYPALR